MIETTITGQPFRHGAILAFRDGETIEVPHVGEHSVLVTDYLGNISWDNISRLPGGDALTTFTSLLDVRPKSYDNVAGMPVTVISGNKVDFGGLALRSLDDVSSTLPIGNRRVLAFDGTSWVSRKIGADILNDLQDVDVTAVPLRDQLLSFGTNKWVNSESFDGGLF